MQNTVIFNPQWGGEGGQCKSLNHKDLRRHARWLSGLSLVAILLLSVGSVSAQGRQGGGFSLVQADYDRYAQLFKIGREPDLSPTGSAQWRALYRNHRWAEHATEGEFRDPMLAAEVLTGIYLTQFVNHQLDHQIESILINKNALSATLSERIVLDRIAAYMQLRRRTDRNFDEMFADSTIQFYSDEEIERMQELNRNIDIMTRRRMVSGSVISNRARGEMRSVQNLFRHGERGWVPTYYFMREKFDILNALEQEFMFNWSDERLEEKLNELMESDEVRTEANRRVAATVRADRERANTTIEESQVGISDQMVWGTITEIDLGAVEYSEEEIEAMRVNTTLLVARERLQSDMVRHSAYKYIVGVYQSSDFHLETLQRIHRYFLNAAQKGDPIAQYHLALFLRYLGVIVDPYTDNDTHAYNSAEWLRSAEMSDVTAKRVEELGEQFDREVTLATRRATSKQNKIDALKRVEWDKIDMIDEVLIGIARRIGQLGGGGTASGGELGDFTDGGGTSDGGQ